MHLFSEWLEWVHTALYPRTGICVAPPHFSVSHFSSSHLMIILSERIFALHFSMKTVVSVPHQISMKYSPCALHCRRLSHFSSQWMVTASRIIAIPFFLEPLTLILRFAKSFLSQSPKMSFKRKFRAADIWVVTLGKRISTLYLLG